MKEEINMAVVSEINDDRITIHSHINFKGKMILNRTEAALLIIELWKFLHPEVSIKVGDRVLCNGHEDVVEQILINDPDGYDVELRDEGTQQFGAITKI